MKASYKWMWIWNLIVLGVHDIEHELPAGNETEFLLLVSVESMREYDWGDFSHIFYVFFLCVLTFLVKANDHRLFMQIAYWDMVDGNVNYI